MMPRIKLQVTRTGRLAQELKRFSEKELDRRIGIAAFEVERRAKRDWVPVDHGRLASSIKAMREAPGHWKVSTAVRYAPFVEFGTGILGAASAQPGAVPPHYVHGAGSKRPGSMGFPARPFLRPALLEVREEIKNPAAWKEKA